MRAARMIRSFSRRSIQQYVANPSLSQLSMSTPRGMYRDLCTPRPAHQASSGGVPAEDGSNRTRKGEKPTHISTSASSATAKANPAEKAPSEPEANTEKKEGIPDIPSTSWSSIGFEEQDAKDPNKWKKFAWKYAGAVLLFMISYKTLHWYTDRLEADGKRKRKEMEEDREIAEQIRSSNVTAERFPFLEPLKDAPKLPETSSELDELYLYKTELENKLQSLRAQGRNSEIRAQAKEVEAELKDLANDIRLLEIKRAGS